MRFSIRHVGVNVTNVTVTTPSLYRCIYEKYILLMRFEWDPKKNADNIRLHGISFELAVRIFEGPTLESWDDRQSYGEDRYIAVGVVETRVMVVVYTERGEVIRPISARKATRQEREDYGRYLRGEDLH